MASKSEKIQLLEKQKWEYEKTWYKVEEVVRTQNEKVAELSEKLKKSEELRKTDRGNVELLHENFQLRVKLASLEVQHDGTKRELDLKNRENMQAQIDMICSSPNPKPARRLPNWKRSSQSFKRDIPAPRRNSPRRTRSSSSATYGKGVRENIKFCKAKQGFHRGC